METMDLKALDSEQLEVYNYLIDNAIYDEDDAYGIVSNYEYSLYDDFESYIYETVEINGGTIPDFIEFNYVCMWLHTFSYLNGHYFIDNQEFKKRPKYIYKDEPEYKRWEFDFYHTINNSRFLEIHD